MSDCCQGTSSPTGRLCAGCPAAPKKEYGKDILDPADIARRMKAAGTFHKDEPWPGWNAGKKLVEKEPVTEQADEPCRDLPTARRGDSSPVGKRATKTAKRTDPRDEFVIDGIYRSAEQRDRIHEDAKNFGLTREQVDAYVRSCRDAGRPIGRSSLRRHAEQTTGQDKMAAIVNMDFAALEERVIADLIREGGYTAAGIFMHALLGDEARIDFDDYDQFEDALTTLRENMEGSPKWHTGGLVSGRWGSGVSHNPVFDTSLVRGTIMTREQAEARYNRDPQQWVTIPFRARMPDDVKDDTPLEVRYVSPDAVFTDEKGETHIVEYKTAHFPPLPNIVINVQGITGNAEELAAHMKKLDEKITRDLMLKGNAMYEMRNWRDPANTLRSDDTGMFDWIADDDLYEGE